MRASFIVDVLDECRQVCDRANDGFSCLGHKRGPDCGLHGILRSILLCAARCHHQLGGGCAPEAPMLRSPPINRHEAMSGREDPLRPRLLLLRSRQRRFGWNIQRDTAFHGHAVNCSQRRATSMHDRTRPPEGFHRPGKLRCADDTQQVGSSYRTSSCLDGLSTS